MSLLRCVTFEPNVLKIKLIIRRNLSKTRYESTQRLSKSISSNIFGMKIRSRDTQTRSIVRYRTRRVAWYFLFIIRKKSSSHGAVRTGERTANDTDVGWSAGHSSRPVWPGRITPRRIRALCILIYNTIIVYTNTMASAKHFYYARTCVHMHICATARVCVRSAQPSNQLREADR